MSLQYLAAVAAARDIKCFPVNDTGIFDVHRAKMPPSEAIVSAQNNGADAFLKLKREEWTAYLQHFSVWERETCIDL